MNVLFTSQYANLYGASRSLLHLAQGLKGRDLQVTVLLDQEGPLTDEFNRRGIPNETIGRNTARTENSALQRVSENANYVWRLSRAIRDIDPDIVYTNNTQPAVLLSGRLCGRTTVYHAREPPASSDGGWSSLRRAVAYQSPDRIIAVSDWVRDKLLHFGASSNMVSTIWNGVEVPGEGELTNLREEGEARYSESLQGTDLVLSTASRLSPHKGLDLLLGGFRDVEEKTNLKIKLLVAGGPLNSEYGRFLQRRCNELEIDESVEFLGFEERIGLLYAVSDLYVTTPVYQEPFGRTVAEAMAHRCPVVATDVGGIGEIIQEPVTGRLVAAESSSEVCAAIVSLLQEEDLTKLGQQAQRRVREHFTVDRYVNEIAELLLGMHQ